MKLMIVIAEDEKIDPGCHDWKLETGQFASVAENGVYYLVLTGSSGASMVRKCILMK